MVLKNRTELDTLLRVLENPVRRRIVHSLSKEPGYPLQLSKDLRLGQQLVAKHLRVMEDEGLVTSSMESSSTGPERREYLLRKSGSIRVDFAPHLFKTRTLSFSTKPFNVGSKASLRLIERVQASLEQKDGLDLDSFGTLISEVDGLLDIIEDERAALLYFRNLLMQEASQRISSVGGTRVQRRVLYELLDKNNHTVRGISGELNLREAVVKEILGGLKGDKIIT